MRLYVFQKTKPALLHTGTLHVCRLLVLSLKATDYMCRVPSEFLSRRLYVSNRPHFLWAYRSDNPRGIVENTNKACKSWAEGEWFTRFSSVLPTSQVGYQAGKPIESVVYCFSKITLSFLWVYRHNKRSVYSQSERAYYLSYFVIPDNVVRNECSMKFISKRIWKYTNISSKWRTK